MSRGLGKLQAELLARCQSFWSDFPEPALATGRRTVECELWRGGEYWLERLPSGILFRHLHAYSHGHEFKLAPPLIDLRLVKKRMAWSRPGRFDRDSYHPAFSAPFSRAARGLVDRKLLERSGWLCHPLRFVMLCE